MGKRILITDDAKIMRRMLRELLTSNGYEVVGEAGDGVSAIELFTKLKPDLITIDITMPKLDGIEVLKCVRDIDPAAKCIIISNVGQQEMIDKARKLGAMGYIEKPFHAEQVLVTLERAFK